jgi:hypothetical protein
LQHDAEVSLKAGLLQAQQNYEIQTQALQQRHASELQAQHVAHLNT